MFNLRAPWHVLLEIFWKMSIWPTIVIKHDRFPKIKHTL